MQDDYESFDQRSSAGKKRDGSTSYEFIAAGFVPVLLCIRGFGRGTFYVLDRNRVKLGRPYEDSVPDIPLHHPREEENYRFSRLHATVDVASGAIGVTSHYRETGGVVVSGRPLAPEERCLIGFGDVIEILGSAYVLESESCALETEIGRFQIPVVPNRGGLNSPFGNTHEGTRIATPDEARDFNIPTILPQAQRFQAEPDGGTYFSAEVPPRALPARPAAIDERQAGARKRARGVSITSFSLCLVVALLGAASAYMAHVAARNRLSRTPELRLVATHELGSPTAAILRAIDLDGDGTPEIVVGDDQGRLHALGADFAPLWSVSCSTAAVDTSVAIAATGPEGRNELWVTTAGAELLRLDPQRGEILERREIDAPSICAPVLIRSEGRELVLVAGLDGSVTAFDLDLDVVWKLDGDAEIRIAPFVVRGGFLVFDAEPAIRYVDERGVLIKKKRLDTPISAPPALIERKNSVWPRLIVVDEGGRTHALELTASSVEVEALGLTLSGRRDGTLDRDLRRSPAPALACFDDDRELDGLVATAGGTLAVFSGPDFSRLLWRQELQDQVVASPAVVDLTGDGRPEVLAMRKGRLEVLDGRDGSSLSAIELQPAREFDRQIWTSVLVADVKGRGELGIVVANRDGRMLLLDAGRAVARGSVLWGGRFAGERQVRTTAEGLLGRPPRSTLLA